MNIPKSNELVSYAKAGDKFHYLWAACRSLRMVYPKSPIHHMVIEGSDQPQLEGEYVIDVSEYIGPTESDIQEINHFQLKHTITQKEQPFQLSDSDIKKTISGFAKRYSEYLNHNDENSVSPTVRFSIITNRPIDQSLKQGIENIIRGNPVDTRFLNTLKRYTKLDGENLTKFCSSLNFVDGEGDYFAQGYKLHVELSQILAGAVDNPQVDTIGTLIEDKVLPNSNGRIVREEIFQRLGVTSQDDLYPAPPEFEKLDNPILRKQYEILLDHILNSTTPTIIQAISGVGKSVFARQITQLLPTGSLGIIYDCFGGGQYLNRSKLRHRHRDALIQIANELASHGFAESLPLIAQTSAQPDEILRKFLTRLDTAIRSLRKADQNAVLVIVIDAADNAEMAAGKFNDSCFVHELLRESLPDGCKLVMLCRPERLHLLQAPANIVPLNLEPFSREESLIHLQRYFPQATEADGLEFHRLTNNGNPRVQANALSQRFDTIPETLASFGPSGTTVEEQIEKQLHSAILSVKDKLPPDYQKHVDAICLGLANLPPFVPLDVLAKTAGVDDATVKSFIADLGRPLWLSDSSVQFRDEPTETWFRKKFSATSEQIASYTTYLKPLASHSTYVAQALPSLLLQAEKYDELINLAISDEFLPENNPIDARNVRVYRLQFAFKAALKLKQYADAAKLALRAGEEVAGDKRQLELLKKNVDLIAPLQSQQKVQELAFRHSLRGGWDGSENVYSAALLSSVEDFKGEARSFLRAAHNWLTLYFDTQKQKEEKNRLQSNLNDDDMVELAFAHFNLLGVDGLMDFLLAWRSPEFTYEIARKFIKRLIDIGNFNAIEIISQFNFDDKRNKHIQYLTIAISHELLEVGRFLPSKKLMSLCLDLLIDKRTRITKLDYYPYRDTRLQATLSFLEGCAATKLSKGKILRVLNYYVSKKASRMVSDRFMSEDRENFLRAVSLRCVLENKLEPNLDELLPIEFVKKGHKPYDSDQNVREFKEVVGGLLPWYLVRAHALVSDIGDIANMLKDADAQSKNARTQRWRDSDTIPNEISKIQVETLILYREASSDQTESFFKEYLKENDRIWMPYRLKAVRGAFRSNHLLGLRRQLERLTYQIISSLTKEESTTRAEWYIDLARAVLSVDYADAAVYFNKAVEAVSKFGDELVERWEAVVSLAKRSAEGGHTSPELAYRFIRCAELIGDNVAREKYFNRNEAVRICARLSPVSALAALSRWRDRDVGWFDQQLPALAYELVDSDYLSPSTGWSLSAFFDGSELDDFASLCLKKDSVYCQYILDTAIRDMRFAEVSEKSWRKIGEVAQQCGIRNTQLNEILAFYTEYPEKDYKEINKPGHHLSQDESEQADWGKILDDLDLTTDSGISQAIDRFKTASTKIRHHEAFWQEVFKRVPESDAVKFLQALVIAEHANKFDIQSALSSLPDDWRQKVSVKQNWEQFLESVARRFASEFMSRFIWEYYQEAVRPDDDIMPAFRKGILDGLSQKGDLVDASTLFGFAEVVSPYISPEGGTSLLDFALTRFELHTEAEYADGIWASWLNPPEDISTALAGFIWSALGSPRAKIRWQAAHCVRRLAEMRCETEINALIAWMEQGNVGAFGSHKFPFYNLHARQYLLIAFARISIDNPQILRNHFAIFPKYALSAMPHILIQKFSAEIALNIEDAFPRTYSEDLIKQLHQVGVSELPIKEMKGHSHHKLESYWHTKGEVDTSLKFHHGYDFDRYWFEPLGNVFGISKEQVEELATKVLVNEWHVSTDGGYKSDPRIGLWNSSRNERETWHDHGSYPRTDNYGFYLSYHSMLVVAAKLLEKMPVLQRRDWEEDKWAEWLERHELTRKDGRWLSDRRDPAPLLQRAWIHEMKDKNWRSDISSIDFLDGILFERNGETWLNVYGFWEDGDSSHEEGFLVYTALVAPNVSQSLLNALATSDPYDVKLPDYGEEDWELKSYPFELKGWIWDSNSKSGLDEFDPHGSRIAYPPYNIGQSIVEKLNLSVDSERREWFLSDMEKPSLMCEIWRGNLYNDDKDPLRRGKRLNASLAFLRHLCSTLNRDLVFKVEIDRRLKETSYARRSDENDTGYKPPHFKIYILSADGRLRDTETHYQLG